VRDADPRDPAAATRLFFLPAMPEGMTAISGSGLAVLGIAPDVVRWQRHYGRHDLPWQGSADPYRVWLSEVMLQQTQVATVIPYFNAFVSAFPTVDDLAAASSDQVMALWSGLGYYSRARNLHAAARLIVERGSFPRTAAELAELPGVGRSTAAAIAVFGFDERAAILDGNVKRLFSRLFALAGHPGEAAVLHLLWARAQAELPGADVPAADVRAYTQGLMDLGATVCTRSDPACGRCPLQAKCLARRDDAVKRYPSPRPRRAAGVREVDMILFCNRDAVLIERRPPAGVWGGLWSLPETRIDDGAPSVLAAGLELALDRCSQFMRFEHAFTHFRMKARVWRVELEEIESAGVLRQTTATRWLALDDAAAAPLPRPVKSLLMAMRSGDLLSGV
jgi:A/G-specific adenine glycosylase